jgi:hypothetical protein
MEMVERSAPASGKNLTAILSDEVPGQAGYRIAAFPHVKTPMWELTTGIAALTALPALRGFLSSGGDIVECNSARTLLVVTGKERIGFVDKFTAAQPAVAIIVEIAEVGVLEHRVRLANGLKFLEVDW